MKLDVCWTIATLLFTSSQLARADWERKIKCYDVDERGPKYLEEAQYLLCLNSTDLNRYPKSIVTITLIAPQLPALAQGDPKDRNNRKPSSVTAFPKGKVLVRRHYTRLSSGKYGRKRDPYGARVAFSPRQNTVLLGFSKDRPRKFYYKLKKDETVTVSRR